MRRLISPNERSTPPETSRRNTAFRIILSASRSSGPLVNLLTGAPNQLSDDDLKLCVRRQSDATKTRLSF